MPESRDGDRVSGLTIQHSEEEEGKGGWASFPRVYVKNRASLSARLCRVSSGRSTGSEAVHRTNPGLITPGTRNTWYFNDDVQTPGIYGDPRCPTEREFFARATRLPASSLKSSEDSVRFDDL